MRGTDRADTLTGGSGDDTLCGYTRNDLLSGGSGEDRIFGGTGRDDVYGDSGGDTIHAADGYRDYIDCGSGTHRVQPDDFDRVVDCEQRFYARRSGCPGRNDLGRPRV